MNTKLTIKNFRVFDENGVVIEFAPVTILTGKNSAGKSSIVKAVAILNSFLEQIKLDKENGKEIRLKNYRIQFDKLFEGTLGNFSDLLHRGTESNCFTFEYEIHSTMLFEDVKVSFSFIDADENKDDKYLHYGILGVFSVKTLQDEIIYYSNNEGEFFFNLNLVKKNFFDFIIGETITIEYLRQREDTGNNCATNKIKDELEKLDVNKRKDICQYIIDGYRDSDYINIKKDKNTYDYMCMISSANDDKHIFYIPVIHEYLARFDTEDIPAKVDEILKEDKSLDDIEKHIIKEIMSDIVSTGKKIDEYWFKQECNYLENVGKNRHKRKRTNFNPTFLPRAFFSNEFLLPNPSVLEIREGFWGDDPRLWMDEEDDKEEIAEEIENWKESDIDPFDKNYGAFMRLNTAYEKWMENNQINRPNNNKVYPYEIEEREYPVRQYSHPGYKLLCEYASRAINCLLFPVWFENFKHIPSSRALPKRLYTPETGKDFYTTLNDYMVAKTKYERYLYLNETIFSENYVADSFLNHWIGEKGFGICKSISVESVAGAAFVVKLVKIDNNEVYLTDEGFGLTQLISILISIETAILNNNNGDLNQSEEEILDDDYYFAFDKFEEILANSHDKLHYCKQQLTIAVEEPEIHLHPAFQSKLAEMFVAASEYNINFIIETHSEYLIRKSQVLVANMKFDTNKESDAKSPFRTYYLPTNGKPYSLGYRKDGKFAEPFGPGFYDESANLTFQIM